MPRTPGRIRATVLAACALLGACAPTTPPAPAARGPVTWAEVAALPVPAPDHRVAYGPDALQFGELRLPEGPGPHPVAVFIHGGCWRSEYDLRHVASAGAALARRGVAVWTPEYRRIGDAGGGWPGTFGDVARATDHLRALAREHPLDLDRVVLVGHSAGGHLALWLAARDRLPAGSPLASADPLPVHGVVALAGITDLRAYGAAPGSCNASVPLLLSGAPEEVPDRYAQASPAELLPLGVPQRLLHGALDAIVPVEQSRAFAERASARGDDARLVRIERAGHFDLVAPFSPAWTRVEEAVLSLLGPR
jgi:acetyl esterase/lipase